MENNPLEELELYTVRHLITQTELVKLSRVDRLVLVEQRRVNGQRIDLIAEREGLAISILPHNGPHKRHRVIVEKTRRYTVAELNDIILRLRREK